MQEKCKKQQKKNKQRPIRARGTDDDKGKS